MTVGDPGNGQSAAERVMEAVFLKWLPAITAIIAGVTAITVGFISWNASRSVTDKDYVALAMTILSNKDSSPPSRRWAVAIVSRLSPVQVPPDLASGLVTGRSTLPSELDPNATREAMLSCLNPATSSSILNSVPGAPLPSSKSAGDWVSFSDQQTGQLDIANSRLQAIKELLDVCIRKPMADKSKTER